MPAISSAQLAAYREKQVHRVPPTSEVDRAAYLREAARGQSVVELGASGPLSPELEAVAAAYLGLDRTPERASVQTCDLDRDPLPLRAGVTRVICGETLEHLSNPGWLLDRVRTVYPGRLILTVPNATSARAQTWLKKGIENVNIEHVAYYSYRTLRTLTERHGYRWMAWHWYGGHGPTAAGLLAAMEPV